MFTFSCKKQGESEANRAKRKKGRERNRERQVQGFSIYFKCFLSNLNSLCQASPLSILLLPLVIPIDTGWIVGAWNHLEYLLDC